ncbi:LAMI_0A04940g1_1 [Lachancea mirantina]|uniref:LAMI_0A04940g1_1 n=1 Tax=Lachancea mirantina TaxID=1230905 RepID=A0A1G4IPE4_9SACH|nr:LAMI_0A04940g1_1 [Lachancea mirantina]
MVRPFFRSCLAHMGQIRRFASGSSAIKQPVQKSRFDKTMLKPAIAILLFGSVLTSVMDQQKKNAELERRYKLKIGILEDLIERAHQDKTISFDVKEELRLVNKLFDRFERFGQGLDQGNDTALISTVTESQNFPRDEVIQNLNSGPSNAIKDESLQDLFASIMKDVNMEDTTPAEKQPRQSDIKQDIVTDQQALAFEAEQEKKSIKYKAPTDVHVIVEQPGEYSTAAADHQVSKFL